MISTIPNAILLLYLSFKLRVLYCNYKHIQLFLYLFMNSTKPTINIRIVYLHVIIEIMHSTEEKNQTKGEQCTYKQTQTRFKMEYEWKKCN